MCVCVCVYIHHVYLKLLIHIHVYSVYILYNYAACLQAGWQANFFFQTELKRMKTMKLIKVWMTHCLVIYLFFWLL